MLIEIRNLSVEYFRRHDTVPAVRNVSLSMDARQSLGIVGESGSGKSTLALSILGLIGRHEGRISRGEILFRNEDLLAASESRLREIRGKDIAMIFQDPFTSLNPVLSIGEQIEEAIIVHGTDPLPSRRELREKALKLLVQVRIPEPERIYHSFPHQVSGGQRQRAMIAMAIANRPALLIADEPTTALDVTVQKEILDLLAQLRNDLDMGLIFITHHLGIIAQYTENLIVLYAGEVIERGKTREILHNPQHPYTRALLRSLPGRHGIKSGTGKRLALIQGAPPDPAHLPTGCAFHPRCPLKTDECVQKAPVLRPLNGLDRNVACHFAPLEPEES